MSMVSIRFIRSAEDDFNFSRKLLAAFIGPMVWELEGPGPILKISNTEVVIEFIIVAISGNYQMDFACIFWEYIGTS